MGRRPSGFGKSPQGTFISLRPGKSWQVQEAVMYRGPVPELRGFLLCPQQARPLFQQAWLVDVTPGTTSTALVVTVTAWEEGPGTQRP